MKRRLLFVDDDPKILRGLRRMLRPFRAEWEMEFADDAEQALARATSEFFDVVVSDVRMPGMDGEQLLSAVKERSPRTARIALSGQTDEDQACRLVACCHQFLSKPCDPETLARVIDRVCTLTQSFDDEAFKSLAGGLSSLPSLPALYLEIVDEMRKPEPDADRLAAIVARDVGMTTKLLHIVNSSFFGLRRSISDPKEAIMVLGMTTLKNLALARGVFAPDQCKGLPCASVEVLWRHSCELALIAGRLMAAERCGGAAADRAFLAGLVHDVGLLIMGERFGGRHAEAMDRVAATGESLHVVERECFGFDHGQATSYLLGLWGLDFDVVEAMAFHHVPEASRVTEFGPLAAVHVANVLVGEVGHRSAGQVSTAFLEALGCAERWPQWALVAALPEVAP